MGKAIDVVDSDPVRSIRGNPYNDNENDYCYQVQARSFDSAVGPIARASACA